MHLFPYLLDTPGTVLLHSYSLVSGPQVHLFLCIPSAILSDLER
jgi:hypothetical protein